MICSSCITIPMIAIGMTLFTHHVIIGLLLSILSSAIYLQFKQFKQCKACV